MARCVKNIPDPDQARAIPSLRLGHFGEVQQRHKERDAMKDLSVSRWEDFQEIGWHWMQDLVHVPFSVYGDVGQGQGGVDLIATNIRSGIVGQSKCWTTKSLTMDEIDKELAKTNDYPGPITDYYILTNAKKHTTVQDRLASGPLIYERKQGRFRVHIRYWSDLKNLDFVPEEVLLRIFPSLASHSTVLAAQQHNLTEFNESLFHTRRCMPLLISKAHLEWLESWDFRRGFVPQDVFDPIHLLSIDMDRVLTVQEHSAWPHWLVEGPRADLFKCLPAAKPLFQAVIAFQRGVVSEASTYDLEGKTVLAHGHDDPSAHERITSGWRQLAQGLLQQYRHLVEGASQG